MSLLLSDIYIFMYYTFICICVYIYICIYVYMYEYIHKKLMIFVCYSVLLDACYVCIRLYLSTNDMGMPLCTNSYACAFTSVCEHMRLG